MLKPITRNMHFLRLLLATALVIFSFGTTNAQKINDPTTWTYEVKKTSDKHYQLIFHVRLKPDWHIWAQKPGGDGLLVPPSFTFNKSGVFKLVGKGKERGKLINKEYPGTDGITHSYEGAADFMQDVVVAGN